MSESKTITGSGTFLTSYTYNSADLPETMAYPANNSSGAGETVTFTYNSQMALDDVNGSSIYVNDTQYDAVGRVTQRILGNSILYTQYTYNGWTTDGGRLRYLTTGTSADLDKWQDLEYDYDASGNINWIKDYNAGGTQTQTFTYDALDRLTSAVASGGSGGTYASETYVYQSTTGNLTAKGGVNLTYAGGTHRVTAAGSNTYEYDANGNMTGRTVAGTAYTLTYDHENRLTEVKIGAASQGTFVYDGDGVRVHTEVGPLPVDYVGNTYEHSNQTEEVPSQAVTPLGYGVNCYDSATGTGYLMYSAESVHERFAAYPPDANNAAHFICVKYTGGVWKYDRGISPYYYTFAPRPDDVLVAAIDFTNDTITSLQGTDTTENGIDKGYASGNLTYTADWWNGQTNDGEFTVGWQPGQCNGACFMPNRLLTVRSYYYAGSTRVAMRDNGVVKYIFGDHLGSTSVIAKADGSLESRRLYKPWGETRYGTTPATTFGFTGQREEPSVAGGLYFYGARWLDPALGRWLSPDSIIPDQYDPQSWDRFAYVNNNPVRYNDPSGHCPFCLVAVLVIGAIILTGDTPRTGAGEAENVGDLVIAGLQHEDHAIIVGEGLQSLQDDPSVQEAQGRVVDVITGAPEYGIQAYSPSDITDQFVADGLSGNWMDAALTGNQAFWMVRGGTISATNTNVSAEGTINTTWHIQDNFDFIPGPDRSADYNFWASIVHYFYNDLFGAEESFPTDAYWDETIPPQYEDITP